MIRSLVQENFTDVVHRYRFAFLCKLDRQAMKHLMELSRHYQGKEEQLLLTRMLHYTLKTFEPTVTFTERMVDVIERRLTSVLDTFKRCAETYGNDDVFFDFDADLELSDTVIEEIMGVERVNNETLWSVIAIDANKNDDIQQRQRQRLNNGDQDPDRRAENEQSSFHRPSVLHHHSQEDADVVPVAVVLYDDDN